MTKLLTAAFVLMTVIKIEASIPVSSNLLSEKEIKGVLSSLNRICSDTFCSGDTSYKFNSLKCSDKDCELNFTLGSYLGEFVDEESTCTFREVDSAIKSARGEDKIQDLFYNLVNEKCLYL